MCYNIDTKNGKGQQIVVKPLNPFSCRYFMKKYVVTVADVVDFKDGAPVWSETDLTGVCASTKSVNNAVDEIKQSNRIVKDTKATDFYVNADIIRTALIEAVAESGVDSNIVADTVIHMMNQLDKGCCFKR